LKNFGVMGKSLDGEWDEDFLVVPPSRSVSASYDGSKGGGLGRET